MAPAPAPSTAPAGALPNTLEVERLYTIACEKVEQQLCLREGGAGEATKTSSTSSDSTLFCKETESFQTDPTYSFWEQLLAFSMAMTPAWGHLRYVHAAVIATT